MPTNDGLRATLRSPRLRGAATSPPRPRRRWKESALPTMPSTVPLHHPQPMVGVAAYTPHPPAAPRAGRDPGLDPTAIANTGWTGLERHVGAGPAPCPGEMRARGFL